MASDPCGRVSEVRNELDWLLSVEDEAGTVNSNAQIEQRHL